MFAQRSVSCLVLLTASAVLVPEGRCGERSRRNAAESPVAALVAELGHANIHRRNAAMTALFNRTPDVRLLLQAAVRHPKTAWWVKRVLVRWAKTDGRVHSQLFDVATSGGNTARMAMSALNDPAVRRAYVARSRATLRTLSAVAVAVLRRGHDEPFLRAGQRATEAVRSYGLPLYVRLFVPLPEGDTDEPPPSDRKLMAAHLLRTAARALEKRRYGIAIVCALTAKSLNVAYSPFEMRPEIILFHVQHRIQTWSETHIEEPAIGTATTLTLRKYEVRQAYRRELAARWKHRFLWPVRTFAAGVVLPIDSSDQDRRARQLIFHSEDLRHVPGIWERAWGAVMPDVATPYRVRGGVISF
ncbi:MAG: hypothetical protein ACE5KM_04150 [Planctomycetaceae bacterium]